MNDPEPRNSLLVQVMILVCSAGYLGQDQTPSVTSDNI